ncbi:MAG: class I SAM-dependent methyltransferase family protein [Ignisphaera sp.]|nr:class I SAM-dependent methyltransferase family protein [Ignisphaera sp.]MCX8167796.1 class I SAM-dependent methyltransferase family protein [Ignisphaera sp.]MDW8086195.1 class I SAM-dependent methyltransferase family protein [Ignisphaera sp.]
MSGRPLLRRIAEKVLGSNYGGSIWKRIEIIGDIAVIRKPFNLSEEVLRVIGEELISSLHYIKSVWLAVTPVQGIERTRSYIHLAGEKRSETIYKEHRCVFKLDVTKVYISPVLGYDHMRVAKQVKENERILNMFAGFGPYSIIVSKYGKPSYVLSIDINESAVRYARENIELNKVASLNEIIHGDALVLTPSLQSEFDRVLMPLPDLFEKAVEASVLIVRNGGTLHPHLFVEARNKREALARAAESVKRVIEKFGIYTTVVGGHVIRGVAPRKYHVTVDVVIGKKSR